MLKTWIAGDCWLNSNLRPIDLASVWRETPPDLFIFNLECSVPAGRPRQARRALLPFDVKQLPGLGLGTKNICILANNHMNDFGAEGVMETIRAVRENGFYPVGAGESLELAREPAILRFPDRTIGILAYSDVQYHVGSVAATERSPGVAPLDPNLVCEDLRLLAPRVDDIWLALHWGKEYLRYPEPEQRELARLFARAGASLVLGMHPHVMRGSEYAEETPVFYSLGNFIFPPIHLVDGHLRRWDRESNQGFVLSGKLVGQHWNWSSTPYLVSEAGEPKRVNLEIQEALQRKIKELSTPLNDTYSLRYNRIRRREVLLKTARRLNTMSWAERLELPGRILKATYHRIAGKDTARVYGSS